MFTQMICDKGSAEGFFFPGGDAEHKVVDFYEETKVKFAELSEEMLWEYVNSGEPM